MISLFTSRPRWGASLRYVLPILLLVLWEVAARLGLISSLFLPAPLHIAQSIVRLLIDGDLLGNLLQTLVRLGFGFVVGSACGILVALAMVGFSRFGRALDPVVIGLFAIPKVAFLPMVVIWFGIGETSKIVIIAIGAFFPVLINIRMGARGISPVLLRAARNLGASERQLLLKVVVPALLPELFAGLKLGIGMALTLTVYAEMVGVGSGIGYLTQNEAQLFNMGKAYGGLVVLIAIAFGLQKMIAFAQQRLCGWQSTRVVSLFN